MERKTKYKNERKNIKRRHPKQSQPEFYRFLDYVDQLVKILFTEKVCRVFNVSNQDIADHLAGLLYCKSFTQELKEYKEKYITGSK